MKVKKIVKEITINAVPEQVWNVLFNNDINTQWLDAFKEGCYAETDWQEGSKAVFKDTENSGLVGEIATARPYSFLAIAYTGILADGVEDTTSDMAREMAGLQETYTLGDHNGSTKLDITSDMGEEWYEMMSTAWDKALDTVKRLAEQQN